MVYKNDHIHKALKYINNAEKNVLFLCNNLEPTGNHRWECNDVKDYLYFISEAISQNNKKSKIDALNHIYNAKLHLWRIVYRKDLNDELHWKAIEAFDWLCQAEESLNIFISTKRDI